jgi:hypothetical protein
MEWRGLRPVWMEPNLLAVSMKMDDGNARLVGVIKTFTFLESIANVRS